MYLILCWSYVNHSLRFVGKKRIQKKKSHIKSQSQYFGKKSQLDYFPKSFSPTTITHTHTHTHTIYTIITHTDTYRHTDTHRDTHTHTQWDIYQTHTPNMPYPFQCLRERKKKHQNEKIKMLCPRVFFHACV